MNKFRNTLGFEPSKQKAATSPYYKPEIEITNLYNDAKKYQYCQCIFNMQWDTAIGSIDIMYATVVLSWFCTILRKGHISKTQHLYGYLKKYTSMYIKFNTEMPCYDNFKMIDVSWVNIYSG